MSQPTPDVFLNLLDTSVTFINHSRQALILISTVTLSPYAPHYTSAGNCRQTVWECWVEVLTGLFIIIFAKFVQAEWNEAAGCIWLTGFEFGMFCWQQDLQAVWQVRWRIMVYTYPETALEWCVVFNLLCCHSHNYVQCYKLFACADQTQTTFSQLRP